MESSAELESPIEITSSTSRGILPKKKSRKRLSTKRKSRSVLMKKVQKTIKEKSLITSSSCSGVMMSQNTPLVSPLEERTVNSYQTEDNKENRAPVQVIDNNQHSTNDGENVIDSPGDATLAIPESHHLDFFSENVSDTNPSLLIEKETCKEAEKESSSLSGQRLFDPKYLFDQLQKIDHSPFSCTFADMEYLKEIRTGFSSIFKFKCRLCGVIENIKCNKNDTNINQKVVQGTVCSGSGFAQLEEFCGFIDMPCMSKNLFLSENTSLGKVLKNIALNSMLEAGREEMQIAMSKGHIDSEGIPYITVVTDGSWGKRSYKTNYNSLSGVACIIGYETKKVLFLGIRNAYCSICAIAKNKSKEPTTHCCFKNWNGSSTSMEADGIAEGFKCSIKMHGLKYTQIIGDGDSSVMNLLHNILPYGHSTPIKKTECSNHLLRNYSSKLNTLTKKTENKFGSVPIILRKKLEANIMKLRRAIKGASNNSKISFENISDQIQSLQRDIKNGPCHVFGDHTECQTYYCKGPKRGEENIVPDLKKCGLWYDIYAAITPLLNNAESLLQEKNNNLAEHFNAIVSKFIGGKRINYSLRGSYEARCNAAATKYNSGNLLKSIQKGTESLSNRYSQKFISQTQNKIAYQRKRRASYKAPQKAKRFKPADEDYGDIEKEPDLDTNEFVKRKLEFLDGLKMSPLEAIEIQNNTVGQGLCSEWLRERKKRLTASSFGRICKMRSNTSCKNIVKELLYSTFKGNKSTNYGNINEPLAIRALENALEVNIQQCGLFLDQNDPFLGASPDGLINNDGIVEVKCPASVADMTLPEAAEAKKITFCYLENGKMKLKRSHIYYYQVQGQLHVTRREFCIFVVWTPKDFSYEKISRDDQFWAEQMYPKLRDFYFNCLLPELIDPRHPRKLAIREKNQSVI